MSRRTTGRSPLAGRLNAIHVVEGPDLAAVRSVARLARHDPVEDPDGFWSAAARAAVSMPEALAGPLPSGLRLLRGLPADRQLPDTPRDSRRPPGRHVLLSELWLSAFGLLLGTPVAFRGQQASALHQNVAPIAGSEHEESDVGSAHPLPLHTENPFHDLAPDYLLLACLRSDRAARATTTLARAADLVDRLNGETVATLRRPIFVERGAEATTRPAPVLTGSSIDPLVRFDSSWTTATSAEGIAAVQALASELPRSTGGVHLQPGDLLLIDNRRWLHGRSPFDASGGSRDRWLQRIYVCEESTRIDALVERGDLVRAPVGSST